MTFQQGSELGSPSKKLSISGRGGRLCGDVQVCGRSQQHGGAGFSEDAARRLAMALGRAVVFSGDSSHAL